MSNQATLSKINNLFQAFKSCSRTQTFNKLAQRSLDEDFHVRGIWAKHKLSQDKFMIEFTREDAELNAFNLYGALKVADFTDRLMLEAELDEQVLSTYRELAGELDVEPEAALAPEVVNTDPWAAIEADDLLNQPEAIPVPQTLKVHVTEEAHAEAVAELVKAETPEIQIHEESKPVKAEAQGVNLGEILDEAIQAYIESYPAAVLKFVGQKLTEQAGNFRPSGPVEIGNRGQAVQMITDLIKSL